MRDTGSLIGFPGVDGAGDAATCRWLTMRRDDMPRWDATGGKFEGAWDTGCAGRARRVADGDANSFADSARDSPGDGASSTAAAPALSNRALSERRLLSS